MSLADMTSEHIIHLNQTKAQEKSFP